MMQHLTPIIIPPFRHTGRILGGLSLFGVIMDIIMLNTKYCPVKLFIKNLILTKVIASLGPHRQYCK